MEVVYDILKKIEELSNKAIEKDGTFLLGVTGGSSTRSIYENLSKVQSDYSKWRVILLDERWVTIDHKDCNQHQVISSFLNLPGFKKDFFFGFHHESIYPDKKKSEDTLINLGKCHLSLLGVGEDGHICGLFPKFLQNDKDSSNLTIITKDSPKPPSPRISVSYSYLKQSEQIFFLILGPSKAHLLDKNILDSLEYPFSYLRHFSRNTLFTDQVTT